MSDDSTPPLTLSPADLTAARWIAGAWGVVIAATWFVLDDFRSQLLVTGVQLLILVCSLYLIYLMRRWKSARLKRAADQRSRQLPR